MNTYRMSVIDNNTGEELYTYKTWDTLPERALNCTISNWHPRTLRSVDDVRAELRDLNTDVVYVAIVNEPTFGYPVFSGLITHKRLP